MHILSSSGKKSMTSASPAGALTDPGCEDTNFNWAPFLPSMKSDIKVFYVCSEYPW